MFTVSVIDPKPMDIVTEVSILRADNQSNSINAAERETDTAISLRRSQRFIDKKLKDSSQTDDFISDPLLSDPVNHPIRMTQRCFDVHKGVYCAAASARHTPHEYSSLNPVPFLNISLHLTYLHFLNLIITYIQPKTFSVPMFAKKISSVESVETANFIGRTGILVANSVSSVAMASLVNTCKIFWTNTMHLFKIIGHLSIV